MTTRTLNHLLFVSTSIRKSGLRTIVNAFMGLGGLLCWENRLRICHYNHKQCGFFFLIKKEMCAFECALGGHKRIERCDCRPPPPPHPLLHTHTPTYYKVLSVLLLDTNASPRQARIGVLGICIRFGPITEWTKSELEPRKSRSSV